MIRETASLNPRDLYLNQLIAFQDTELVGDRRHTHSYEGGDVADTELRLKQRVQYLYPRAVTEYLVQLGEIEQRILVGHYLSYLLHGVLMNVLKLAGGRLFFFRKKHFSLLRVSVCEYLYPVLHTSRFIAAYAYLAEA